MSGQKYPSVAAREIMDLFQGRPFRSLIASSFNSVICLAKYRPVAIICPPPTQNLHNKHNEPFWYPASSFIPDYVNTVNYNSAQDSLQQMNQHKSVLWNDDDLFNNVWGQKEMIGDRYEKHRSEFLNMLGEFEDIWIDRFGRTKVSMHRTGRTSDVIQPECSAPYRFEVGSRNFAWTEINRMIIEDISKSSTADGARWIFFSPKIYGLLRILFRLLKDNTVAVRNSCPRLRMYQCINGWEEELNSSTFDRNLGYW